MEVLVLSGGLGRCADWLASARVEEMIDLMKKRALWAIAIFLGLLLLFFLAVGAGWFTGQRDPTSLEQLRQEPALKLVYPQATKLHQFEKPKESAPLEGFQFGAQIRDYYGTAASDEEIEAFYRKELEPLGWRLLGVTGGRLLTYKRLLFKKDRLTLELRFWYKEDFERQLPSIDTEGFTTIYELLIVGPAE